jgi:hypothetical protein
MRAGKYPGSWYCPRVIGKDDDGETMFCKERLKVQNGGPQSDPVQMPSQNRQEGPQNAPGTLIGGAQDIKAYQDQYHWYAALTFASKVFQGTGKAAEALELAAAARALLP